MRKKLYPVTEVFTSIQGEGIDSGRLANFIRLSGCNLDCAFCDTNHSSYKLMSAGDIIKLLDRKAALTVITGGEPLIHDIRPLVFALKKKWYQVGIETNGTKELHPDLYDSIDSISLSPKVPFKECKITCCSSLKILYPWINGKVTPENYESLHAVWRFIQPVDSRPDGAVAPYGIWNRQTISECIALLKKYPDYRIGIQLHKVMEVQ